VVGKVRWRDLRHTFITRLAEQPEVSEQAIMSLAGHVSRSMLARYGDIRSKIKQAAIARLEEVVASAISEGESLQESPQSGVSAEPVLN